MALAWCTGISWGYAWPVLGFVPILAGALLFANQYLNFSPPKWFFPAALGLLFLFALNLGRFAYQDQGPYEYHLGDLFPKAAGIYTGEENFEKHEELKQHIDRYGSDFTLLPAMPLVHFLDGSPPKIPIDWAHDAEANWTKNEDWLRERLNIGPQFVFIENDKLHEAELSGKYGSSLTAYAIENWKLVENGKHFSIYSR